MTINIIQDIPTPHNNVLIAAFLREKVVNINLWYAKAADEENYSWKTDLANQYYPANIYGKKINFKFLFHCIRNRKQNFIIVGWQNTNTMILHLLFYLFRIEFAHWTDLPIVETKAISFKQLVFRKIAYKILKYSRSIIFGVGEISLNHFRSLGFNENRLYNLPIFVDIENEFSSYKSKRSLMVAKYGINEASLFLSAGSRLVRDKGFDLLISAINLLHNNIRENIRLIIVGNGPELNSVQKMIEVNNLKGVVFIESWMEIDDFKAVIYNSDVFIHPARVDTFGGTIFAMSLGVPVLGSMNAGAAVDRIIDRYNGFLYEPEDILKLSSLILFCYKNKFFCKKMGENAYITAKQWPPSRGVKIIIDAFVNCKK